MVANMLGEINRTLNEHHKTAIDNFRRSNAARHSIMNKMLPIWRKVQKTLDDFGKAIGDLNQRAKRIDRHMDEYEQIRRQTDKAVRKLSSSSLTRFFISSLVLMIAFGGGLINFKLIALPMSEMVGGASFIGPYKTSDVAGLVIILIQLTMGLFLMESLRITRLFPVIGSMDDKIRLRMIWVALLLLTAMAGVESSLAFLQDRMAQDIGGLGQTPAGVEQTAAATSMIPTAGQMISGVHPALCAGICGHSAGILCFIFPHGAGNRRCRNVEVICLPAAIDRQPGILYRQVGHQFVRLDYLSEHLAGRRDHGLQKQRKRTG